MRKALCILTILLLLPACGNKQEEVDLSAEKPKKALFRTAKAGDIDKVKELMKQGADVNARNKSGQTILHVAVATESIQLARLLLAKGADVNSRDSLENTPLHEVQVPQVYITTLTVEWLRKLPELLVANGADLNAKNKDGLTPLHCLASRGGIKAVLSLYISRGADVNAVANNGYTPLDFAVNSGNSDTQDALRELGGRLGRPLRIEILGAAREGKSERVKELLSKGANVNARDWDGNTPLHLAALGGSTDTVKLLITKGADINLKNVGSKTPLDWAITEEMKEFLRAHGAVSGNELERGEDK